MNGAIIQELYDALEGEDELWSSGPCPYMPGKADLPVLGATNSISVCFKRRHSPSGGGVDAYPDVRKAAASIAVTLNSKAQQS